MKISVSILSSKDRKKSINIINKTDIDYLHIDVMDGKFVENKAFSIEEIKEISLLSNKKLDVHLMVNNPINYIDNLNIDIVEYISFHIELNTNINYIISKIKSINKKICLAISPDTPIEKIVPYLNEIDMVLIMSVVPGKGGQLFIPSTINKIEELKKYNNSALIEVDGGINDITIKELDNIDIAVVGSFITNNDNYQEQVNKLR